MDWPLRAPTDPPSTRHALMAEPPPSTETPGFIALMQRGSQLHQEGHLPQALIAFEEASHAAPGHLDASSAMATMLILVGRPLAAREVLRSVGAGLLETADGAANLAIAAESCGDVPGAHSAYERALQLDPDNLRALTNAGLIAARLKQWDTAIARAKKCVALQPGNLGYRQTLSDVLTSARRYTEALQVLEEAAKGFPDYLDITIRHITVLAFSGELENAAKLESGLNAAGKAHLREFLVEALQRSAHSSFELLPAHVPFCARQLFAVQAFAAMDECDWRDNARLARLIREILTSSQGQDLFTLGKDSPFYGLALDLDKADLVRLNAASLAASGKTNEILLPAFTPRAPAGASGKEERIRIGFAIQELRQVPALKQQLACSDSKRFSFHVYSFAPPAEPYDDDALKPLAITLVEMAHLSDAEAVGRIRLDSLDIYVDTAPDARSYRPQVAGARVARVQLRQHSWFTSTPAGCWDYTVSDTFMHSSTEDQEDSAVVRLSPGCWLATHAEHPAASPPTRESAGLPAGVLVLCSQALPASLDAFSFSQWMKILRSLPDAMLWLPACPVNAAAHLLREAENHGVQPQRLLFSQPMTAAQMLASLAHADLMIDTLRVSQAQGVDDALNLGLPVITCAGESMASRWGGSILHAAGLAELVADSPAEYVEKVVRLGREPEALRALRDRVRQAKTGAPLTAASTIRAWEAAWTVMAKRSRAGLAPTSFNAPSLTGLAGVNANMGD